MRKRTAQCVRQISASHCDYGAGLGAVVVYHEALVELSPRTQHAELELNRVEWRGAHIPFASA